MTKLETAIRQVSDLREFYVRLQAGKKTNDNPEKAYNKAGWKRESAMGALHAGALIENHADRKKSFEKVRRTAAELGRSSESGR